ncbi:MAG: tyrosine-type recombinase/integrase [Thermoguttaceae bacterium]
MAKKRKPRGSGPHQKAGRKGWYLWVTEKNGDGVPKRREIPMGDNRDEAFKRWHEMASHREEISNTTEVTVLLTQFLDYVQQHRAKATYDQYAVAVDSFGEWLKREHPGLKVNELRRGHLIEWAEVRFPLKRAGKAGGYAKDTVRDMMASVQRAFNWAVELDKIPYSPIAKVRKPGKVSRATCLLPGQWNEILVKLKPGAFRDFLVALRFTGCRPQEVRQIEARHLFLDQKPPFWTLELELVKGGQEARITPLVGPMPDLVKRLAEQYPEGSIFRNREGNPWTGAALHSACYRLMKKTGLRIGTYTPRHTFRNHAGANHAEDAAVATVMGHKDTRMGRTAYNHYYRFPTLLAETMEKATAGEAF